MVPVRSCAHAFNYWTFLKAYLLRILLGLNFARSRCTRRRVALRFSALVGERRLVVRLCFLRQNERLVPLATLHP